MHEDSQIISFSAWTPDIIVLGFKIKRSGFWLMLPILHANINIIKKEKEKIIKISRFANELQKLWTITLQLF